MLTLVAPVTITFFPERLIVLVAILFLCLFVRVFVLVTIVVDFNFVRLY